MDFAVKFAQERFHTPKCFHTNISSGKIISDQDDMTSTTAISATTTSDIWGYTTGTTTATSILTPTSTITTLILSNTRQL